jgi:ribosomal protein S18 acetylase RimI-like enzyme
MEELSIGIKTFARLSRKRSIEANMIQEATLTQAAMSAPLLGQLRKMRLTEFSQMVDLAEVAFAEDEAREGRSLRSEMKGIQSMVPILRILFKINPGMEDHFTTLVWEIDQKFVALVTVSQQGGDKTRWYIANVATHPDYRGRGLARKLVIAGLDHIRARGGQRVLLDVRSDNPPAYNLYKNLGFSHLDSETIFKGTASRQSMPALPAGHHLRVLATNEWQPRFQLTDRLASAEMKAISPISANQFQLSAFTRGIDRLISRAQKRTQRHFVIEHLDKPVALASCSARGAGENPHQIQLAIDPAYEAVIPALLAQAINFCLDQIPDRAEQPILITLASDLSQSIGQLQQLGFKEIETTHTLGLKL